MAKLIIAAALLLSITVPVFAQTWTGQQIGNFTYWNGPGKRVTCQQIGQFTYCN